MSNATGRIIKGNGINLNVIEQGESLLVLLCHGFPESSYFRRHQLGAIADAGFHAVAPNVRDYGKSDRPEAIDQYKSAHESQRRLSNFAEPTILKMSPVNL